MEESSKYKVVITGFGPFQGVPRNESWLAVSGLWGHHMPSQVNLVTRELPVVYDIVKDQVEKIWNEEKPDLIIHVGVSKSDHQISLEKCSFNLDYVSNDISNKCPANSCCVKEAPDTLHTELDVDKLCELTNHTLRVQNFRARCGPSTDPGRYLCGFTYFYSLYRDQSKSLFVHVPDENLFPINEMTVALKSIIFAALKQLYNFEC